MAQEIYNEGRVIGLSAWEIFAKASEAAGAPESAIPTESQWLTAMIGSGMSMVLKVPSGITAGIHDFPLPSGSVLAASGVILANPFLGECTWDTSAVKWATKVTSYSPLIPNTSGSYPSSSTVPTGTYTPTQYSAMVEEFVKITDGVVFLESAKWENAPATPPTKDINPDYNNSSAVVRLYLSATLNADVNIIFTGFQNKRILQAFAGYATSEGNGSTDVTKNDWVNGGMLGPEVTPWATKIIFSVPSAAHSSLSPMTRILPSDATYTEKIVGGITFKNRNYEVKTNSLLDFNSINLTDYFNVHSSDFSGINTIDENVTSAPTGSADSFSTLTAWYPGMTAAKISSATDASAIFPPALYATQFNTNGTKTMVPMDTAAPGTVKAFETSTQAANYLAQMPDNYAIYHNPTSDTYSFAKKNEPDSTKWTGTAVVEYLTAPKAKITAGNTSAKFIALTNSSGTDYNTAGTGANPVSVGPSNNLTWDNLLTALTGNKAVDVLGTKLHNLGAELTSTNTIGKTYSVTEVGADKLTITGSNPISMTTSVTNTTKLITAESGTSFKAGTNFIEFSNGKRLYIDTSAPATANVPVGSIGIGW